MRCRRQFDDDRVARPNLAVCQDDGHDAGLADESTVFISSQHCGHQPWLEAVQLDARVTQTSHFDDCRLAQAQARTGWESEQINAARCDVLAHLSD